LLINVKRHSLTVSYIVTYTQLS